MNVLKLKSWSERQQVVAVILMAGAAIFALWFFLLTPLNRQRHRLEKEIEGMRSQLAAKNYLLGEEVLQKKRKEKHEHNRYIRKEWTAMASRLAAFPNEEELVESHVGHIDFKVALFDVRQRLLKKSRALNISLPHDLGMDDAVHSDEDARKLMLQLRTVEKLVDLTFDLKISMLRHIEPLPPMLHVAGSKGEAFLEEYPVRVKFYGSLENLFNLFQAVLEPDHVFAFRHLRIEAVSRKRLDLLSINAVMSALLFLKDPDELAPASTKTIFRTSPMGY